MVQSDLDILLKEFFKDTIASQCKLISRVCPKRKLRQTCNQLYQMKCSTLFCMSKQNTVQIVVYLTLLTKDNK